MGIDPVGPLLKTLLPGKRISRTSLPSHAARVRLISYRFSAATNLLGLSSVQQNLT